MYVDCNIRATAKGHQAGVIYPRYENMFQRSGDFTDALK
jgi:hypothetical protein